MSARSASAFSVPFLAIVQKSDALFVMKASVWVDDPFRLQPAENEHGRAGERDSCLQAHSTLLMMKTTRQCETATRKGIKN